MANMSKSENPTRSRLRGDGRMFEGVSPRARKHLENSMRSLEAGRAPTPAFKLYGSDDWSLVEKFFKIVLQKGISIPEWQLKYEMSRQTKWGLQGGYEPWEKLKPLFNEYYENPRQVDPSIVPDVRDYYILDCRIESIPNTLKSLIKEDKIQDRAAGWSDFDLKKTDPKAQADALAMIRTAKWKNGFGYPFSRFNKLKPRIFFPMPFPLMILEAQYYHPFLRKIQDSLRSRKDKSPYTFWADKIGFGPMFSDIVSPIVMKHNTAKLVYIMRDFTHMDTYSGWSQTSRFFLPKLKAAFHIKKGTRQASYLDDLFKFGASCPIYTPDGFRFGFRGKPSGATTTNGDETCGNEEYNKLFKKILTNKLKHTKIKFTIIYDCGNGDDGMTIGVLDKPGDLDSLTKLIKSSAEQAAALTGYAINPDKWDVRTTFGTYCQRMVAVKGKTVWEGYPASLILNSICHPEHEYAKSTWDKDYRDLDIIEKLDNGSTLEYFHELVDYVDNGMKYGLLGRSETETKRILFKFERYRALQPEKVNWQDLETRLDIFKSPTVRYLLAKRGYQALIKE